MIGTVIFGSGEFNSITRGPQPLPMSNVIRPLAFEIEFWIALRRDPLPESLVFVTVCTKPAGAVPAITGEPMAAQTSSAHDESALPNTLGKRCRGRETMRMASSPSEAQRLA